MGIFNKKRADDFKRFEPAATPSEPVIQEVKAGLEELDRELEETRLNPAPAPMPQQIQSPVQNPQPVPYQYPPQVQIPIQPPKPEIRYVEVPVDISDEKNLAMMIYENNRMLKQVLGIK